MLIPVLLFGQNEPNTKIDLSKNNIYAEAHFGLFTKGVMNYERQIYFGEKLNWYCRLGGGYGAIFNGYLFDVDDYGWGGLVAFTMLQKRKTNKKKYFEFNTGIFLGHDLYPRLGWNLNMLKQTSSRFKPFISPIFNVGYRYQNPEGGLIFRANLGLVSAGLSLGYAF